MSIGNLWEIDFLDRLFLFIGVDNDNHYQYNGYRILIEVALIKWD